MNRKFDLTWRGCQIIRDNIRREALRNLSREFRKRHIGVSNVPVKRYMKLLKETEKFTAKFAGQVRLLLKSCS